MAEYQQTQTIDVPAGDVFAWLSDVGNLPKYLPPVMGASIEGPSVEGAPGQRLRATLEYPDGAPSTARATSALTRAPDAWSGALRSSAITQAGSPSRRRKVTGAR